MQPRAQSGAEPEAGAPQPAEPLAELAGRSVISGLDLSTAEVLALVERARELKAEGRAAELGGRVAALLFFAPSLRTRVSCEAAFARGGGSAVTLSPGDDTWRFEAREGVVMDGATQEHVRELGGVLSRLADVIGVRRSELVTTEPAGGAVTESYAELARDRFLTSLASSSSVPVVNLESNRWHPLQGLADAQTIVEKLGQPRGAKYVLTWAWHPKALPVATPHSQLLAAADLGMEVTLLRPPGYGLDPEVVAAAAERARRAGGSLRESEDAAEAFRGARIVCAKSWGALESYGRFDEEARRKEDLRAAWRVDARRMEATDQAWFLHCLPVRRNVIVTDEVLDGPRSAVIDEAENRLWTAAALFEALLRR